MKLSDLRGGLKDVCAHRANCGDRINTSERCWRTGENKPTKLEDMSEDRGQQRAGQLERGCPVGVPEDWSCSWRAEGTKEKGEAEICQDSSGGPAQGPAKIPHTAVDSLKGHKAIPAKGKRCSG